MKNEKKLKIAIFGGSFDPPHYGHYDIVKNLERTFDSVIVVPSFVSPFKSGADDARSRLSLCKKLFASQKTSVCPREINRGGISYSVDTVEYLRKKYKTAELYFVIGTEELSRLTEWHDIDRLKTLVTFLAVPRPMFEAEKSTLSLLKNRGVKIKIAAFEGLDISSTVIKIDAAFGKPNKSVPDFVKKRARANGLFNPYGKYVEALYKYGVTEKRIEHSYGVAVRGAELAKKYGVSVNDAVIACILHDIAKSVDPEAYSGKVDVKGFPPPTVHSPIGAYIARTEFGVSDEIAHAIYAHTTADSSMSLLDEVVYLADKTEMGRNYNEVYYFRYLCDVDRNAAMYKTLTAVTEFKDNLPCEMTADAIANYKAKCVGKKFPEMPVKRIDSTFAKTSSNLPAARAKAELSEIKSKSIRPVPDKSVSVVVKNAVAQKEKTDADDGPKAVAFAIAEELSLHKARDIDIVDLSGKTIIADYFVIASASSSTAVKALYGYVEDRMTKQFGQDPSRRDIDREWVALDFGSCIVHIFTDKTREFYNIERLWSDGGNVTRYGE